MDYGLIQLSFVYDFDRYLFANELVFGQLNFGKVAFAYCLNQPIFADVRIVGVSRSTARTPRRITHATRSCGIIGTNTAARSTVILMMSTVMRMRMIRRWRYRCRCVVVVGCIRSYRLWYTACVMMMICVTR